MKKMLACMVLLALLGGVQAGAVGFDRDLDATPDPQSQELVDQINGLAPIPTPEATLAPEVTEAPEVTDGGGLGFERDLGATPAPEATDGGGLGFERDLGATPAPEATDGGLSHGAVPGGTGFFAPLDLTVVIPEDYTLTEGAINALSDTQAEYSLSAGEGLGSYSVQIRLLPDFADRSLDDIAPKDYPALLFAASLPTGARVQYHPDTDLGYGALEINLDSGAGSHLLLLIDGYLVDLAAYPSRYGRAEEWQKTALYTLVRFGAPEAAPLNETPPEPQAQREERIETALGTLVITPPEGYGLRDHTANEVYDIELTREGSDTVYRFYAEKALADLPDMRTEDLTGSLLETVLSVAFDSADRSMSYEEGVEAPDGRRVLYLWDDQGYEAGWMAIENGWIFGAEITDESQPLTGEALDLLFQVFRVE